MKRVLKVFAVLLLVVTLAGCGAKEETYTNSGISITMDSGFAKKDLASATVYYESKAAIVTALKEELTNLAQVNITKDSSIEDYLTLVLANNQSNSKIETSGDLKYFAYEKEVNGKTFYYVATGHKSEDAFWLLNFACDEKDKDEYHSKFIEWAKSVSFK